MARRQKCWIWGPDWGRTWIDVLWRQCYTNDRESFAQCHCSRGPLLSSVKSYLRVLIGSLCSSWIRMQNINGICMYICHIWVGSHVAEATEAFEIGDSFIVSVIPKSTKPTVFAQAQQLASFRCVRALFLNSNGFTKDASYGCSRVFSRFASHRRCNDRCTNVVHTSECRSCRRKYVKSTT